MPLAYPFGSGQPLGCRIFGPPDEVSSLVAGSTARVGPFCTLTKRSPSRSFRGHACRPGRPTGLSHLPQSKSLQLAGFGLGQLRDEFDRARIFIGRYLALDMLL